MIRRPPRSTQSRSSAASDVYKRQIVEKPCKKATGEIKFRWLGAVSNLTALTWKWRRRPAKFVLEVRSEVDMQWHRHLSFGPGVHRYIAWPNAGLPRQHRYRGRIARSFCPFLCDSCRPHGLRCDIGGGGCGPARSRRFSLPSIGCFQPAASVVFSLRWSFDNELYADFGFRTPCHRTFSVQLSGVREQQDKFVGQCCGLLYLKTRAGGRQVGHDACAQDRPIGANYPCAMVDVPTLALAEFRTHRKSRSH